MREAGYEVGGHRARRPPPEGRRLRRVPGARRRSSTVGRTRLQSILTPGHTEGSICFKVEGSPVLFSGDTLFPGGPGNTTFPGGDFPTIIRSIEERLFVLPDDTIVLPGHGLDTTIGTERPHLQEWIDRGW